MRFVALSLVLLLGCPSGSDAPPRAAGAQPKLVWRDVGATADLAALAAEAAAGDKALLLDVRADWCAPCIQLERETFTDPDVRTILGERFLAVRLDVTDPSPAQETLQGSVGGAAMPWIAVWPLTPGEVAAFAEGRVPAPAKTISTFVSAQELLPTLRESSAR